MQIDKRCQSYRNKYNALRHRDQGVQRKQHLESVALVLTVKVECFDGLEHEVLDLEADAVELAVHDVCRVLEDMIVPGG